MRSRILVIVAGQLLLAASDAPVARAQGEPHTDVRYLLGMLPGKCIGYLVHADFGNILPAVMPCAGAGIHTWEFLPDGEGFYRIADEGRKHCLTMVGDPSTDLTPLTASQCYENVDAQKWRTVPMGPDLISLKAKLAGRCIRSGALMLDEGPTIMMGTCGERGQKDTWALVPQPSIRAIAAADRPREWDNPPAPVQDVLPKPGALHTVVETSSGRCLGYTLMAGRVARPAVAMECSAPGFHELKFIADGSGAFAIADNNVRMCLEMAQDPAMYRAPLSFAPCVARDAQRWKLSWKGGSIASLATKLDGRCARLHTVMAAEGPTVALGACGTGGAQETWQVTVINNAPATVALGAVRPAPGADYTITETTAGKCLGYVPQKAGWAQPPATGVVCDGSARREWELTPNAAGFYEVRDKGANACLTRDPDAAKPLMISGCAGNDAQKWRLLSRGDATLSLVSKSDGRCARFGPLDTEEGRTVSLGACSPLTDDGRALVPPGELWRLTAVRRGPVAVAPRDVPRDTTPPVRQAGSQSAIDRFLTNWGSSSEYMIVRHFPARSASGASPTLFNLFQDTWNLWLLTGRPQVMGNKWPALTHSDSTTRFMFRPAEDGRYVIAGNRGKQFLKVQGENLSVTATEADATRFIVRGDTSSLTIQVTSDNRFLGTHATKVTNTAGGTNIRGAVKLMSDALENDSNFGHWQLLLTHRQGPFQVHANQQWFDTGIDLFEGETFATYVAASDRWTYGGPQSDGFGVRGETSRDALLPTMALGMLVGRVGASAAFQIGGAEHRLTSPARGRLYLSINDVPGTFADNRGYMGVVIY